MTTYEQFDVVVVPFPFTDRATTKKRPALVLSVKDTLGSDKTVMAMITTKDHQPWKLDIQLTGIAEAGLRSPSIVRFKLFTLDDNLIDRKIGKLNSRDRQNVKQAINKLFDLK